MRRWLVLALAVSGCGDPRLPDSAKWLVDDEPGALFAIHGDAFAWRYTSGHGRLTRYAGDTGETVWSIDAPLFPRRLYATPRGILLAGEDFTQPLPALSLLSDAGETSVVSVPSIPDPLIWDVAGQTLAVVTPSPGNLAQVALYDLGADTPRLTIDAGLEYPASVSVAPSGRVLVWSDVSTGVALYRESGQVAWSKPIATVRDARALDAGTLLDLSGGLSFVRDDGSTAWTRSGESPVAACTECTGPSVFLAGHTDYDETDGDNDGTIDEVDLPSGGLVRELAFYATPTAVATDDGLLVVSLIGGGIVGLAR